MGWQQLVSLGIVAVAALLIVRREVRRRRQGKLGDCGEGCNCSPGFNGEGVRGTRQD